MAYAEPKKDEKVYQFAYVNSAGILVLVPGKMTYSEAIMALDGTAGVNAWTTETLDDLKSNYKVFGIYTEKQEHALALAAKFGQYLPAEVHGNGQYGHYHDKWHIYHVWFGEMFIYP